MFEKVKLKTYLLAVFSAIIVLGGILTAVSVFGMGEIESNTNKLLDNIIAADTAIKDCRIHVNVAARTRYSRTGFNFRQLFCHGQSLYFIS